MPILLFSYANAQNLELLHDSGLVFEYDQFQCMGEVLEMKTAIKFDDKPFKSLRENNVFVSFTPLL